MDIIQIRRELHQHPELGFEENWTSDYLAGMLEKLGLEVSRGVARTGVVGVMRGKDSGLSAIGYRADMDALPVVECTGLPYAATNGRMHACGHDSHMAVALGVAEKLVERGERPRCDVVFVFQPNEEGAPGEMPSGAELMCREGVLEKFRIGRMVALHSDPTLEAGVMGICRGTVWSASGRFHVTVTGKSAHAAYPERGRDALWAAAAMVEGIYGAMARRRPAIPEVVSVCQLKAGTAFNVIAGESEFEGIFRAPTRKILEEIAELMASTIRGIADGCGVGAKVEFFYGANAVINDDNLVDVAIQAWIKSGLGRMVSANLAAEDFSHFADRIPSFYAMMGIKPPGVAEIPPSHSDHFILDESALPRAVEAMVSLLDGMMLGSGTV